MAVTPAPSPSPSPSPSPTPTPAATYKPVYDFSADFRYALIAAAVERVGTISAGQFVQSSEGRSVDARAVDQFLSWNRASEMIALDYGGAVSSFGPNLLASETVGGRQWRLLQNTPYVDETLTVSATTSTASLVSSESILLVRQARDYDVSDGTGRRVKADRYAIGGATTIAGDLPSSGQVGYRFTAISTSPTRDGAGGFGTTADAVFDFGATNFVLDLPLVQGSTVGGNQPVRINVRLRGTYVPSTGRFEGTAESPDSDYTGTFAGAMFGPRARQIGIVFVIGSPTRQSVVGSLTGLRS
ncbi:hypothetical protein [Tsuneonella dongtanensis]|uniref:hypothetical protein n=1 Tax=Tsuneonella dongtanensis TaxID=692370 RepID=UPI0018DBDEC1|nr:hypothetical protein [Tsuneonella dongtanensis]